MWTMIHQVFLDSNRPAGGIDTWILDFQEMYSHENTVLGILSKGDKWLSKKFPENAVSTIPNSVPIAFAGKYNWLPVSLKLGIGLTRHRKLITDTVLVHRVELAFLVRILKPKTKIVLFIHTDHKSILGSESDSKWSRLKYIFSLVERLGLKSSNLVFSYSKTDAARVSKMSRNFQLLTQSFSRTYFYRLENSGRESRVLWVGRFEKPKNPILAIKIFEEIVDREPELRLSMYGDGSLRQSLVDYIRFRKLEEKVEIHDPVDRVELGRVMRSSRLLLHTSHFEGAPRILLEAAACELPFVTNVSADPENIASLLYGSMTATSLDVKEYALLCEDALSSEPFLKHNLEEFTTFHSMAQIHSQIKNLG